MVKHFSKLLPRLVALMVFLTCGYLSMSLASAQQARITVSGKVVDAKGVGIPGAGVMEQGTTNGSITDNNGNYSLRTAANAVLDFSCIGYKTVSVPVDNKTVINVTLNEDAELLDDVVVVGYGAQKKANLTGAVDQITSETMERLQVNTMGQALQGQVPNLEIGIADGKPGRAASFNIRGTTSLNGGSPLILIDGVPSSESQLNNLSPKDVENISILKDAASAAIYGARGTYGVILVQTKKAKKGEFRINYTNSFALSKPTKILTPYDNATDYLDIIQNEFNNNIGQYNIFPAEELEYARAHGNQGYQSYEFLNIGGRTRLVSGGHVNDFFHEWFNTYSPSQNHHISVTGGADKIRYFISGDFNHEKGNLKMHPDKVNRYTLTSNVTYDLTENISLTHQMRFLSRQDDNANAYIGTWRSNIWRWLELFNHFLWPTEVEYNGETLVTESGFLKKFLEPQYSGINKDRHEVSNTLALDMNFFNNTLRFHGDFNYQHSDQNQITYLNVEGVGPVWLDSDTRSAQYQANQSYIRRWFNNDKRRNVNAYATYENTFVDAHHVTLMAGFNYEDYDFLQLYGESRNPFNIANHSLNLTSGAKNTTDSDSKYANQSTFGRINYDFKGRYLFEINSCYNITSRFAAGNRDAFFLSGSAAWRVSEEPFFQSLKPTINNLKFRASYGELGNQNVSVWGYLPTLSITPLSSYTLEGAQVPYTSNPSPKSSNYTWETAKTIDFGIDFGMFDGRFTTVFDWYRRNTYDMLAPFHTLPSVFGATVPQENNAELKTTGWELTVGWNDKFDLGGSDFHYGAKFVMSDYQAEITSYYNPTNYLGSYYEGQKIGEIWGINTLGLYATDEEAKAGPKLWGNGYRNYAAAGTLKFEDKNNDGIISRGAWTKDDHGDFDIIGNTTPRYQFGFTLNAQWKGFDFTAFFKGIGKRNFWPNGESVSFWGPYSRRYVIMPKHVAENRWTPDNPDAYFPRPQGYIAGNGAGWDLGTIQTRYLQDASYCRLKNIVLGYTLPKKLTRRAKMENVRFYISGQNLFEVTKLHKSLDPEGLSSDPDAYAAYTGTGTVYPMQRAYLCGLEIQF
ncbi:MAG: TonB-dependent receptor [Bacteroidales bacterium]|nr:TonB-dependent receptor [Bacteroidales bacterium]